MTRGGQRGSLLNGALFSTSAAVGQTETHIPHATHLVLRRGTFPVGTMSFSASWYSSANAPTTSAQIRSHLRHWMHLFWSRRIVGWSASTA